MSGIILIVFIASGIIGLKKPIIGAISGCLLTIVLFFVLNEFKISIFLITSLFGFIASFAGGYSIPWFFSGFMGGKHNTGPSFIGGGRAGGGTGGIVFSDEERENLKKKKNSGGIR